jgi:hypothetical protein
MTGANTKTKRAERTQIDVRSGRMQSFITSKRSEHGYESSDSSKLRTRSTYLFRQPGYHPVPERMALHCCSSPCDLDEAITARIAL